MTMDKSLKVRLGLARARSVLTRDERIQRLKAADRWQEGDDPYGLPKVRVFKLAMKKKKKKKEEGRKVLQALPRLLLPPRPAAGAAKARLRAQNPARSNFLSAFFRVLPHS